ncbi:MAG: glutamine--fructose-6-phosphate transaminase (isomerizing) [Holosporales bacterium]|jgi:glucosamine--fructose-6-phosphate aminotransferase (isomerizing)|nr:glutamine--fructose-6-phosphate transaminase (isomerizing) [Holosporales bacterium]
MCGIASVLLNRDSSGDNLSKILFDSLKKLEYRGYDSAGIAVLDSKCVTHMFKSVGEVENLKNNIDYSITGNIGIAHTRWATHGEVSVENAHPHKVGKVSVAHNGIVENYNELKKEYLFDITFNSETDTEVISALIHNFIEKEGLSFEDSFRKTLKLIKGMYAIVAISESEPGTLIGAKYGSPLVIGCNNSNDIYIASDAIALSGLSRDVIYMKEGDIVIAKNGEYKIYDSNNNESYREKFPVTVSVNSLDKTKYEDHMLSEICEEPEVLVKTYDNFSPTIDIKNYKSLYFIACGTSYYAGLLAKYWIEDISGIHVNVEIASEFRYRNPVLLKDSLYVFISQSGETIDTLCAMRKVIIEKNLDTLSIVNVPNSSIARESKYNIQTYAGTEIGVASTKAFISQALTLLLLIKNKLNIENIAKSMQNILDRKTEIANIAEKISKSRAIIYMGRGTSYPIAMEGALKMKELSYISSDGCPSGEIKHGPIALIDSGVSSIILAPKDRYYEKTLSNAEEILARHGAVYLLGAGNQNLAKHSDIIEVQNIEEEIGNPFILTTTVHLLAYYTAKVKGLNIDKPRNLAKSVTVE